MLRNSTQLQAFFEERRRIKANQKQKLKERKDKENKVKAKEYQRTYYQLQKEIANSLKINKLQEIYDLAAKIAEEYKNKTKEITTEYRVYRRPTRERETNEEKLYTTWDEIKEAEKRGEGKINWPHLFQLIKIVKQKLSTITNP